MKKGDIGFSTKVPFSEWDTFIKTNVSFYNKREARTVNAVQLNVANLIKWSATNSTLRPALGSRDIRSIYIADMRTQSASTQSGVKVVEGAELPGLGLTVATPNPLYVQGHYNAQGSDVGKNETKNAKPASLVGDSINILSTAWLDSASALAVSSRLAGDTTVNAAILAGIVPSGGGHYSGGVENFPRFLENWSGRTLTYNGSMVSMFNARPRKPRGADPMSTVRQPAAGRSIRTSLTPPSCRRARRKSGRSSRASGRQSPPEPPTDP